jgi:hypothetical protein
MGIQGISAKMPPRRLEEVFVTEGVPQETFVEPPNFGAIFVDVRHPGKPVIIEGQSGTGKTTTVRKILEKIPETQAIYLTARQTTDCEQIERLALQHEIGTFIIDDFHRLPENTQILLVDIAKLAAEQVTTAPLPKLVLIGINQLGSSLIQFVPDIAKRCGIHSIIPADEAKTSELIALGCLSLGIEFDHPELVYNESRGDYWLSQLIAQTACSTAGVFEHQPQHTLVSLNKDQMRQSIVTRLDAAYRPAVKEFCRGRRFRPSNDPYFKLLRAVSEYGQSNVDLTMLANSRDDVRQSINNVKDRRLTVVLESRPNAARYFYYNAETKQFSIDDPAVFYYIRHLDWEKLRVECGFRETAREYEFDVALSFAGENRDLARFLAENLRELDMSIFYDELYETNYLGKTWTAQFERIFQRDSRFVICLLDECHREKIWPTFERECFLPRVSEETVLPIYLDDTRFPGIPTDLVGIKFGEFKAGQDWREPAVEKIIMRVIDRIG